MTNRKGIKLNKKIVAAGLVLVAAGVLVFVRMGVSNASKNREDTQTQTQTDEVSVRSLMKSVGATGTVVSVQSKDLTVALSDAEVTEVFVKVGDTVAAGDELLAFDTEDVEKDLEDAQSSLNKAEQKNSLSISDADRNVNDAERTRAYQVDSANTTVANTYSQYESAVADYESAAAELETLKAEEAEAANVYTAKEEELKAVESTRDEKQNEYKKAQKDYTDYIAKADHNQEKAESKKAVMEAAELVLNEAQTDYNNKNTEYTTAKSEYEAAQASRKNQEETLKQLNSQVTTQKNSYDAAVKDYNNVVESQSSSVESAKSSRSSASLSATTDAEKQQVEQYEEQLENGKVTAPFDGVITAVNYKAGDTYTGGALITIQDCSSYEIEAEINEYDISDVVVGQEVLIKTNATGDEKIEGSVISISPVATAAAAGSVSTDITYTVKIALNQGNERLRLDMSASISIIIENHEEAYTVPYNAVEEDEDGSSYITQMNEDGTEGKKIPVDIVMESNYYTEIASDEISEGMKVKVIEAKDEESDESGGLGEGMRGGF